MPYTILIPAHRLGKFISHLGVRHYITKTHLGGQDTLQRGILIYHPACNIRTKSSIVILTILQLVKVEIGGVL
jgi:hypothetical protein